MKKSPAHRPLEPAQLAAVADLFSVLSEPSRLRILQFLQRGPATVTQIVEGLHLKQANVSKQLGILTTARVVERQQQGNFARYSIAMPLVFDLCALVCKSVADLAARHAKALAP
ncbi:MAG TPA: metalloregulator ArsR/SmtB family transcription factor [Phycisphaerae bacterium]|nr:metalloregulator ArsR/SmtB family transcription factor [Phycisphaerae bacterium]